jgi:hypothetical protein
LEILPARSTWISLGECRTPNSQFPMQKGISQVGSLRQFNDQLHHSSLDVRQSMFSWFGLFWIVPQ